jgi:hypothetical protein
MSTNNNLLQRKRKTYSPSKNSEKNKEATKTSKHKKFILKKIFDEKNKETPVKKDDTISKEINLVEKMNNKELKEFIIQNKLENFMEKEEYDFYLIRLVKYISSILSDSKLFKEDYTNYIYNNLRALIYSKDLDNILKFVTYNKDNEFLFLEFLKYSNLRWEKFISNAKKYNIDFYNKYLDSINPEKKIKNNFLLKDEENEKNKEKFDIKKSIEIFQNFPEDNQLELFVSGIVYNSMKKNEQEGNKEDKLEIQNFNLSEIPMISVLSGIKFNKNILEINLNGNSLSPKSCFYLGSCIKTLPFLTLIDISKCDINNDKLYMFIEGTNYSNENLSKKQFCLNRLNLKDNPEITDNDTKNSEYEHPLALIIEKFKLKWLNLTNAKLGGKGINKLFKKMIELLETNQLFIENLIIINNDIKNEECLSELGDLIIKEKCPLKKLILSKNLISTFPYEYNYNNTFINYYEKFMKSVAKSKLEELFLINCEIGNNDEDINILYEMLKENKSLKSIRLFGNKINNMESFAKILGIFSDYNKQLENNTLKSLDLSKNNCNLKIDEDFMKLVESLKLEYLDVNQNLMQSDEKEIFKKRTNELSNIRIIY